MFITNFAVSLVLHASTSAKVQPRPIGRLARPIERDDSLRSLKELWAAGARGALFQITDEKDHGFVMVVENWEDVRAVGSSTVTALADAELLRRIQTISATDAILFHNRCPAGGWSFGANTALATGLANHRGELRNRPFIMLNGWSTLYVLHHEEVHHSENLSGFNHELRDRLWADRARYADDRNVFLKTYRFIKEARANHRESGVMRSATRATEWEGTDESDDWTEVAAVPGPDYRAAQMVKDIGIFNEIYGAGLKPLLPPVRAWARSQFERYIPEFTTDYDEADRWRGPCAARLGG